MAVISVPQTAAHAASVGIGWRHPHYGDLLEALQPLDFIEVHSENFFAESGAALAVLRQGREHYPVSLHGVGLALGSAVGIDAWHLDQLARLVEQIDPIRVSDHTCYARGTSCPVSLCGAMHAAWLQGRPRWGPGSKNPPAQWSLPAFYGTACSPAQTKLHPTD